MNNVKIFEEDDDDLTPNTPVVKDNSNRDKDDPNEVLLGDDEMIEDDTDNLEDVYDED